jgi:hypothetical protein
MTQKKSSKYYINKRTSYYISNLEVFFNYLEDYVDNNLLTSEEFLKAFINLYEEMEQNFRKEKYRQPEATEIEEIPSPFERLKFASFQYLVYHCKSFLKSENYSDSEVRKLVVKYDDRIRKSPL